ncbi:hypothetical protein RF55_25665, partial [Lasius niger]
MDEIKKVGQVCAPFVTGVIKSLAPETPATASVTAASLQAHSQTAQPQTPAPQVHPQPVAPTYQQQAYQAAQQPQPAPASAAISSGPKNPFENDLEGNDKPIGQNALVPQSGGYAVGGNNWLEQQRQQTAVPFFMLNAQGYMVPVQTAPGTIMPAAPQGYQPPMMYANPQAQQQAML